jgi:hypothetical protein
MRSGYKIYEMAVKYTKWQYNLAKSFIERHSKIYPMWDFWFENIASGSLVDSPGGAVYISIHAYIQL